MGTSLENICGRAGHIAEGVAENSAESGHQDCAASAVPGAAVVNRVVMFEVDYVGLDFVIELRIEVSDLNC